jgi:hypothetical protein
MSSRQVLKTVVSHLLGHIGLLCGYLGYLLELLQSLPESSQIENLHGR